MGRKRATSQSFLYHNQWIHIKSQFKMHNMILSILRLIYQPGGLTSPDELMSALGFHFGGYKSTSEPLGFENSLKFFCTDRKRSPEVRVTLAQILTRVITFFKRRAQRSALLHLYHRILDSDCSEDVDGSSDSSAGLLYLSALVLKPFL